MTIQFNLISTSRFRRTLCCHPQAEHYNCHYRQYVRNIDTRRVVTHRRQNLKLQGTSCSGACSTGSECGTWRGQVSIRDVTGSQKSHRDSNWHSIRKAPADIWLISQVERQLSLDGRDSVRPTTPSRTSETMMSVVRPVCFQELKKYQQ
jgi:hypothetical protein